MDLTHSSAPVSYGVMSMSAPSPAAPKAAAAAAAAGSSRSAASAPSSVSIVKKRADAATDEMERKLECAICLGSFVGQQVWVFDCEHGICGECVKEFGRVGIHPGDKKKRCPECQRDILTPLRRSWIAERAVAAAESAIAMARRTKDEFLNEFAAPTWLGAQETIEEKSRWLAAHWATSVIIAPNNAFAIKLEDVAHYSKAIPGALRILNSQGWRIFEDVDLGVLEMHAPFGNVTQQIIDLCEPHPRKRQRTPQETPPAARERSATPPYQPTSPAHESPDS